MHSKQTQNKQNKNILLKLLPLSIILAYLVIILGAYTRLTDAGLGCPDWPYCYGRALVSNVIDTNINASKAWTEMIHRYLAGTLGSLIFVIAIISIIKSIQTKAYVSSKFIILLPILLILTVIFQALLGMWTVTLKLLPTVVMGHLLGGLILISLLILLLLNNLKFKPNPSFNLFTQFICAFSLIFVFIQIILGGWTSSNYAAIPCLDFPSCNGQYLPAVDTLSAMNPFVSIGPNYEGGLLDNAMRVTIQLFHRWGALITCLLVLLTSFNIRKYKITYYHKFSIYLIILLITQVTLGILNIKLALPLLIAIMHNGIACLLLLSLIVLNYKINYKKLDYII